MCHREIQLSVDRMSRQLVIVTTDEQYDTNENQNLKSVHRRTVASISCRDSARGPSILFLSVGLWEGEAPAEPIRKAALSPRSSAGASPSQRSTNGFKIERARVQIRPLGFSHGFELHHQLDDTCARG